MNSAPAMRRLLLVPAVLSVVAIGCGSSDDVIAKADRLCKVAQAKQLALLDGTSTNSKDPKVMKAYLESSLSQTKEWNKQLAALEPPSDLKKEWTAWTDALSQQEKASERLIETVKPGMDTGPKSPYVQALNSDLAGQVGTNKKATDLGLDECGQLASI